LAASRDEYARDSGFTTMTARIKGGKEMATLLKGASKTKSALGLLDEAEFIFHRALKQFSGAINKQHGQIELTNGRGINALEKRHEIYRMVCKAYPSDPDCAVKVKEIMDWWLELANDLYGMAVILKSQKKVTPERANTVKAHLVRYGIRWRKVITWKCPVYWKMHMFECCLMNFIKKHGVAGRVSAEGFENKHHAMANLKSMLSPMVKTSHRVNKLVQRQSIHLLPGLDEKLDKIESQKKRTGRRGPYNVSGRTRNIEEIETIIDEEDMDDRNVEGYFWTLSNFLLPIELQDVYNIYERSKVPDEWHSAFESSELLADGAKFESSFLV
jgi:hypothetical protein